MYENWTRIPWDGNPDLNLECFRKSFGRGYVSIGIGDFTNIVYSYGADSVYSICGTRWREEGNITEEDAMIIVDKNHGHYNFKNNKI